jgi:hypothetical protein
VNLRFDDQAVLERIHAISAATAQIGVCDIHTTSSTAEVHAFDCRTAVTPSAAAVHCHLEYFVLAQPGGVHIVHLNE